MDNDPLQEDQNNAQGLPVPQQIPNIDWSKARPAFPKQSAAPAPTTAAPPAGQPGIPNIDWSSARPAFSNNAPTPEPEDQGIVGNAVDFADKYLTRKAAEGGVGGLLASAWQPNLGIAKGVMETLHTAGALGSHALRGMGINVPDVSFDEPQYLEAHGTGQTVGKVGEGVLEFFLGDEALKGATMAEKLKQATKLAEFMESSPRLSAALTTGVGALRMGAVSAAQTGVHGGTAEQALESGATTGALGGALSGLGAISRVTSSPALAKVATGAEIAGGTAIAGQGAVSALTPAQPGETPQQSLERRVNGVVQGILGVYGAKTAAGEARTNLQAARGRQTADLLRKIEDDTFWTSPTSKGKTAGNTPEALTYRETIRAAKPQFVEVVADNPTASTPKEMARAVQGRIDGVEGRLRREAESTQGYDESVLHGVEDDFRVAADEFYKQNKGAYKKDVFDKAVDETVNRLRQGEGEEPRDPNLFEAENLRQQLNAETGEAPDRSSALNALKQEAVRLLRDKIDQGYESLGIKNVKEWRKQEANLIKLKDQIQLGEKAMEAANKTPLLNRFLHAAGWGGLGVLFGGPFGGLVGGGLGFEISPIIREYMQHREANPETHIARIQKNVKKLKALGYETKAIVPEFPGAEPGVVPKVLPASDPNATAGVIRETGSLRQQPLPEAPPEIADAVQGTGLQFIGSDSMGLSHFHDPRTNHTYSVPTDKVTQDELLTRMAAKAAPAQKIVPYINDKPKTVSSAEENFVRALQDYQKAKKDMLTSGKNDKLKAQQKVREAAQASIQAQEELAALNHAWSKSKLEARIASDKQYTETFKPTIEGDVPHKEILESSESPVRETMNHEYGHAAIETLLPELAKRGVKAVGIQALTHPDLANAPGTLAATQIDYGELAKPDGGISREDLQHHLGDLLQIAAMGGAMEELVHGTKIKGNGGLEGDIKYMKHYMNALDIPESTQKWMIDRAYDVAKQKLKTPGVLETIQKYSYGREAGLDDPNMHASRDRIQKMNEELKKTLENPNAGNNTRTSRLGGEGDKSAAAGRKGETAGVVPETNVKRASAAGAGTAGPESENQERGLTDKHDHFVNSIGGSLRAIELRSQIAALGDRMPLERQRLQEELTKQEQTNRDLEEQGTQAIGSVKQTNPTDAPRVVVGKPEEFHEAVINTPDALLDGKKLTVKAVRYQKPEQAGQKAIRTGVFYLPESRSPYTTYYKTPKNVSEYTSSGVWYGGSQRVEGQLTLDNPIVAKGASGGNVPKKVYDVLKGKGAYEDMRSDVLEAAVPMRSYDFDTLVDRVSGVLEKYGGNPALSADIVRVSKKGNQLPLAIQEHIVASAIREAGHDGVVGYTKVGGKNRLSEIFHVTADKFPTGTNGLLGLTMLVSGAVLAQQKADAQDKKQLDKQTGGAVQSNGAGKSALSKQLPEGMVKVGNIDVNHRPIIRNKNGSVSTIFSVTVPNEDGTWSLVPSIVNGKFLTPDGKMPDTSDTKQMQALKNRAAENYKKTGEHLGVFKSEKAANDFAEQTHSWTANGGKEKVFLPPGWTQNRKEQK